MNQTGLIEEFSAAMATIWLFETKSPISSDSWISSSLEIFDTDDVV